MPVGPALRNSSVDPRLAKNLLQGKVMFGGGYELLILAAVFLLLFGGAKLPSLMRNMGRSVNEFKTGMSEQPVPRKIDNVEADVVAEEAPVAAKPKHG